jgi:hypothetical protein
MFGAAPLIVMMLVWPATPARAFGNIFTEIFGTIGKLGNSSSSISAGSTLQFNFMSNTLYPQALVNQGHLSISGAIATFRPWMAQVMGLPTNSASMPSSQQLESTTRGGVGVPPSQMSGAYQSTYGKPLSTTAAAPIAQTVTDMSDSQVLDAFSLTSATDYTANVLISQSHKLEDDASTTAPGNADHLSLQGKALQLYSEAVRHRLLATNLRMESVELANQTAAIKQQMTNGHYGSTYAPHPAQ